MSVEAEEDPHLLQQLHWKVREKATFMPAAEAGFQKRRNQPFVNEGCEQMCLMLSCGMWCGMGFGRCGSLTSSAPCGKPGADQRQSRSIHATPKSELEPLFVGQTLLNSWCWETSSAKRCLALAMMSRECWRCPVFTPLPSVLLERQEGSAPAQGFRRLFYIRIILSTDSAGGKSSRTLSDSIASVSAYVSRAEQSFSAFFWKSWWDFEVSG